jgi:hypothetical protein
MTDVAGGFGAEEHSVIAPSQIFLQYPLNQILVTSVLLALETMTFPSQLLKWMIRPGSPFLMIRAISPLSLPFEASMEAKVNSFVMRTACIQDHWTGVLVPNWRALR